MIPRSAGCRGPIRPHQRRFQRQERPRGRRPLDDHPDVSPEGVGYVYAVLAIVSAIAADKVLRNTIDGVLNRMEQQAENTTETGEA